METLICSGCGMAKPDDGFYRAPLNVGRRERASWCKLCTKAQVNERRRLEREAGIHQPYDPEYQRDYHLRSSYGISADDYDAMYQQQCGVCAICNMAADKLHVDHDHETAFVRGLLCNNCNTGLGMFADDTGRLAEAVEYLDWAREREEIEADPQFWAWVAEQEAGEAGS